jgi:proteic killer suppression protein
MKVVIAPSAYKTLSKAPNHVQRKFEEWVRQLDAMGLQRTSQQKGWHDEPLKGSRKGQRSIRLNNQWRAIYTIEQHQLYCHVLEVTPHDYRTR